MHAILVVFVYVCVVGASPPNIVLLLLDDHGYGDIGVMNPQVTETPHMDALAKTGVLFTDFHSGASVCTPSRAALLTGRLGLRTGVTTNFGPFSIGGIPRGEILLPELLPEKYTSHMIGKWHLGHHEGFHPSYRGFDTFYGLPYSGDMGCLDTTPQSCKPNVNRSLGTPSCPALCNAQSGQVGVPLYDTHGQNICGEKTSVGCNHTIVEQPVNEFSLNTRYSKRAVELIKNQSQTPSDPFFLYVGFAHTHTPITYNETKYGNASSRPGWRKLFGNGLAELDAAVGDIVKALQETNLMNNTIIWLLSDNGPADLSVVDCDFIGTPGPYQGLWQKTVGGGGGVMKDTTWEGGHRVVSMVSWPGTIPPNVVSNELLSALDIVPTLIAFSGGALPKDRSFDGLDISDVMLKNASLGDRVLFHPAVQGRNGDGSLDVVRVGKYKLFWQSSGSVGGCNGGRPGKTTNYTSTNPLVFDVAIDPAESNPIQSGVPPGVIGTARQALELKLKDIGNTLRHKANMASGTFQDAPCCDFSSPVCRCPWQKSTQRDNN